MLEEKIITDEKAWDIFNEYIDGLTDKKDKLIVYSFLTLRDDDKPWEFLKMSRSTYFRRKAKHRDKILEMIG